MPSEVKTTTLRINSAVYENIKLIALMHGLSVSDVVDHALRTYADAALTASVSNQYESDEVTANV